MDLAPVPDWLAAAFPKYAWKSLRSCNLLVNSEGGAGLDMEASDFGYIVEGVDESPGQPEALHSGVVVIAINDVPLMELSEEDLESTFGEHFGGDVSVLLADVEELKLATTARASKAFLPRDVPADEAPADEVLEHGSVIRVPLNSATFLRNMEAATREQLGRDLALFGEANGVRAELHCVDGASTASIALCGEPESNRAARAELGKLLEFYGLVQAARIEVEGMSMKSMPARNRRRRRAREEDEEEEEENGEPAAKAAARDRNFGDPMDGLEDADGEGAVVPIRGKPPAFAEASAQAKPPSDPNEMRQYEFMDHTADVILHSWGRTLEEAFAQNVVAFFSYMTELDSIDIKTTVEIEATGHDLLDLLYHVLDEFLFSFASSLVVCRKIEVIELDEVNFRCRCIGHGEQFSLKKHPQGTEIKAITMHMMKILKPDTMTTEHFHGPRPSDTDSKVDEGFPYEAFVLVDI